MRRLWLPWLLVAVLAVPPISAHGITSGDDPGPLAEAAGPGTDEPRAAAVSWGGPSDPRAAGLLPVVPDVPGTGQGVTVEPGTPWRQVNGHRAVQFECPQGDEGTLQPPASPDTNVQVVRGDCPYRIIDDADLLGSPDVAIRQDDPREVAFFSLHGAATDEGPTPRSREPSPEPPVGRLSHTTFTSVDGGWDWEDNPYAQEGFGETVSGLMDRDGNMVVASLFSRGLGEAADGTMLYDYFFRLYKEDTVQERPGYNGKKIENRAPGNVIDEVNLVLVTPRTQVETQEEYEAYRNRTQEDGEDNGTAAPSSDDQVGNYTIPRDEEDHSDDIVMAVWHEKAYDWRNASTGRSSWIDAAWTDTSSRNTWDRLDDDQLIGPCRDASNPVSFNGRAYVACVVDAGYNGRRGARIGEIDIWAIDPKTERKEWVGWVDGLLDGRPRLAANDAGLFAIATVRPLGDEPPYQAVDAGLAFGWYGRSWDVGTQNIGFQLHNVWNQPFVEARITDMVLTDDPQTAILSYMERTATDASDPQADPTRDASGQVVEYHKAIASYEYCMPGALSLHDLQVGLARHPFQEGLVNDITGAFDDLHDGMDVFTDPSDGRERVAFAYGDHGVIQYGVFTVDSVGGDCPIAAAPPLFTPTPAAPSALLLTSGAPVGLAVGLGAPLALGLGYLLVMKRRTAMAAATKAR